MRDMEFRRLKPGDCVYSGSPDDVWTVVCPFPRHDSFLLMEGKCWVPTPERWFWSLAVRLPDIVCLAAADWLKTRVKRIFDPQKWVKYVGA
jgi:hypothetical protein